MSVADSCLIGSVSAYADIIVNDVDFITAAVDSPPLVERGSSLVISVMVYDQYHQPLLREQYRFLCFSICSFFSYNFVHDYLIPRIEHSQVLAVDSWIGNNQVRVKGIQEGDAFVSFSYTRRDGRTIASTPLKVRE